MKSIRVYVYIVPTLLSMILSCSSSVIRQKYISSEDIYIDWWNLKSIIVKNYEKHIDKNYFDIDTSFIGKPSKYFLDTNDLPTSIFILKLGYKFREFSYGAVGHFAKLVIKISPNYYTGILVYHWYTKKKSRYAYFVKRNKEYYCALYVIYYNGLLFD